MGGFLYTKKSEGEDAENIRFRLSKSLTAFESKGLSCRKQIIQKDFIVYIYDKARFKCENFLEFDNGDFIVATGTPIYKRCLGKKAINALYCDFDPDKLRFDDFYGHFGVLVKKNGSLFAFNDFPGVYGLHCNEDKSVISNSFLAVLGSLRSPTLNTQELYEYLSMEATLGEQSIVKEISVLPGKYLNQILPSARKVKKHLSLPDFSGHYTFEDQIEIAKTELINYFGVLAELFGDRQSIGLTGGYDSRMILACMRQNGITPRVYVQGDHHSVDVQISQAIAMSEGFDLDYREDEAAPTFDLKEFSQRLNTAYYYLDGIPQKGLFNDWAMVAAEQRQRERYEILRTYGAGGEMFRNFWQLPPRSYSAEDVVRAKLSKIDLSHYTGLFDRDSFINSIAQKFTDALGKKDNYLSWEEIELANSQWLLRDLFGGFITNQNDRSFALIPFTEPVLAYISSRIPLRYKYFGKFQSRLIQRIDPELARHKSAYGHAFNEDPGLWLRILEYTKTRLPIPMRPAIRSINRKTKTESMLPFYLGNAFIEQIFPTRPMSVSSYVNLEGLETPDLLSRSLSVEFLILKTKTDVDAQTSARDIESGQAKEGPVTGEKVVDMVGESPDETASPEEIETEFVEGREGHEYLATHLEKDFSSPETAQETTQVDPAAFETKIVGTGPEGDPVASKLDLARTFVDTGDAEGAKSTLEEVVREGDEHQRHEAEELLTRIA